MKLCILGNGLTSLTLAKTLVNMGINVDIFSSNTSLIKDTNRTIGISKSNIEFFNKNIFNIQNILWNIDKIEIYSEKLNNKKILDFENKGENLFYIVKNRQLAAILLNELKKSKLVNFYKKIPKNIHEKYKLVINCDFANFITKKYFYNKFKKDYNSRAYTSVIKHSKKNNKIATQIFTSKGPIAFLPISKTETSVVYSFKGKDVIDFPNLIRKFNRIYEINSIQDFSSFDLKSSNLRVYYHKNILAFGDLLHKIHPLAGQGFNMSIRDIKEILKIINMRLENGLDLDSSICLDFEKKMKHKNYIFSNGIDFVYEFFNFETKISSSILSKSVKFLGKNKVINSLFTKFADNGINI